MAEVEYGGIKIGGSKLLLIIPLIGTLGGGLWAGFEFYKDYMDMREAITNYTEPDLSHLDEHMNEVEIHMTEVEGHLNVVEEEFKALKQIDDAMNETIRTQVNSLKDSVGDLKDSVRNVEKELKADAKILFDMVDKQDKRNRENLGTVRDLLSAFELRIGAKMDTFDTKVEDKLNTFDTKISNKLDAFESRMDSKIAILNSKIATLENNVELKIRQALSNPLSN